MKVLTVPNWSFGRSKQLLQQFESVIRAHPVELHYLDSDPDHNRTVSAFSGEEDVIFEVLTKLSPLAVDAIDLSRHIGVHPRIGALDVCPFVLLEPETPNILAQANALAERFGAWFAGQYEIPVFLYEQSERGRHEADLPALRKGGFGALLEKTLTPDFGPSRAHPRLGITVIGVRPFLIALNVNLKEEEPRIAKVLAKKIRELRSDGDSRFLGVRVLGLYLASQKRSQVSLNVTLPDITPLDPIIEWILKNATRFGVASTGVELIGVIRPQDCVQATRVPLFHDQIVRML